MADEALRRFGLAGAPHRALRVLPVLRAAFVVGCAGCAGGALASAPDRTGAGPLTAAADTAAPTEKPDPPAATSLTKPGATNARRGAPLRHWRDGHSVRALWIDGSWRADFSPLLAGQRPRLRPSTGALPDVPAALQSPILRDETGRARALPGGVLLTFARPVAEAEARALLAHYGVTDAQPIGERIWLVPTAPGLAALDLADRLAASGAFASAAPNWWAPAALK
jgi:hypothetical protein